MVSILCVSELDLNRQGGPRRRRGRRQGPRGAQAPGAVHAVRVLAAVLGVRAAVEEEDGPHAEAHLVNLASRPRPDSQQWV